MASRGYSQIPVVDVVYDDGSYGSRKVKTQQRPQRRIEISVSGWKLALVFSFIIGLAGFVMGLIALLTNGSGSGAGGGGLGVVTTSTIGNAKYSGTFDVSGVTNYVPQVPHIITGSETFTYGYLNQVITSASPSTITFSKDLTLTGLNNEYEFYSMSDQVHQLKISTNGLKCPSASSAANWDGKSTVQFNGKGDFVVFKITTCGTMVVLQKSSGLTFPA